ncbi:ubiquitin carboxyl-terminal hydrolase 31-like isoform X2 [Palaemon carinicauda]
MNGHAEPRRKRSFMSFRLSKKPPKPKDAGVVPQKNDVNQNPSGLLENSTLQTNVISENGAESLDGGSDSSSASVKPKKKYLTRMSSFVSRVASKVQGAPNAAPATGPQRGKLERSKTISVSDLQTHKIEDYVVYDEGKVPGVIGIRNHGNTCFINAVVQCLSHTDVLAEYFVLDQYKLDLARCNKINSKKFGTRGEITEQLAVLLKALWTLRYVPDVSMNFKNTVDKYEAIYRGSQQHDAAEFLMFILDKVHEDLNTASKRKYKKIKNTYGRPDEVVAAETLANHLRCNSSFVHDIFQAQFRSSLKCPHCQKESNTFDPFLCVSIPIPQREVQSIFVTVVYLNQQPKQVKLGVSIESNAIVRELRKQLAEDCGIPSESLILTEVDGEGFHRTFADGAVVSVISDSDPVYAIELPPHKPPTQESGAFILITWVNVVLADPDNIRFGSVYQSQVVRDVSYVDLQKLLLKEMTTMVTTDTLTSEQESGLFLIGVDDGGSCVVGLDPALDVPLFHESVEQALALCEPTAGPPHVKLILQWTSETKEKYIVDDVDHVEEHSSVKELKENPLQGATVSLHQCLQLHTSAEKLGCGDAWHCPTCNRKQQVVKRLMLWSAPQILVLHLKRFRQGTLQTNSSKLSTTVRFPLLGFDISEHVASRSSSAISQVGVDNSVLGGVWSPWKRPKRLIPYNEYNVYDLHAVVNHHGKDMQGGHYTAMCKNTADNKWYNFDDSKVEVTSEDQVVNPDAYILFYQRRSDANIISTSCSEGGEPEHWAYRIPISYLPASLALHADREKAPPPFERGRSYGTLPVNVRSPRQSSAEREHASDTEAPLASHEESPVMKRKSTSTLHEAEDSPDDENEPKSNLKITTVQVEVIPSSQDGGKNNDTSMECDDEALPKESQEQLDDDMSSNKTVLITKCQSTSGIPLDETDGNSTSSFKEEKLLTNDTELTAKPDDPPVPLLETKESEKVNEEKTPEVRIHPATPEVLAAHQAHAQMHPKRSVITLTLRPRNPSESSSCGTPDSRVRSISRTPSMISSCSTSSVTSNPVTNGIDQIYQNGCLDDRDECEITPEIRITPLAKSFDAPNCLGSTRLSTRSTNTNKTPSFVVINTPTASPRPPRLKTTVTNGYSNSPRPYTQRPAVKPRDPSAESFRSQRSVVSRKENGGASVKQVVVTNGKNYTSPTYNYIGPVKTSSQNGYSSKHNGRYERGEMKYNKDMKADKRDSRYEREDKFEREHRYERESRYERELKYDQEPRFERETSYEKEFRYERNSRSEREYSKHERENGYDSVPKYERDSLPKYDRDSWCSRDFKYDRGESSRYERDTAYEDDLKFETEFMYNRAESRFDIQYKYEKDSINGRSCEIVDHCPQKEYPSGLNNTATTPPVITESSV